MLPVLSKGNKHQHENAHLKERANLLNKKKIIVNIVVITKSKFVLNPKLDDAKTLGIIKKIMKGFVIPPVK